MIEVPAETRNPGVSGQIDLDIGQRSLELYVLREWDVERFDSLKRLQVGLDRIDDDVRLDENHTGAGLSLDEVGDTYAESIVQKTDIDVDMLIIETFSDFLGSYRT